MNLGEFRSAVLRRLGNLDESDPVVARVDEWINEAQDAVVLEQVRADQRKFSLFPELRERWRVQTTVEQGSLLLPENCFVLEEVYSYDQNTLPDQNTAARRRLTEITEEDWEIADRTASNAWPERWTQINTNLHILPVPQEDYDSYLQLNGYKLGARMTEDNHEPTLAEKWHSAMEDYAVYLGAEALDWTDTADRALSKFQRKIASALSPVAVKNAKKAIQIRVKGFPIG